MTGKSKTYQRMPSSQTLYKLTVCLALFFLFNLTAAGQNMSGMPDYGSYVRSGGIDAVSVVDGQVTLNIPISSHQYRGFPYQFGLRYSSNMWRLNPGFQPCHYYFTHHQDCGIYFWMADNGGWQGSSNQGGALMYSDTVYNCTSIYPPESSYYNLRAKYAIRANYVFQDYASGRIYQFPVRKYRKLDTLICPEIGDGNTNVLVAPSDEGGMQLDITNDVPSGFNVGPSTYKITLKDGATINSWDSGHGQLQQIRDTNGNTLTFDGTGNTGGLIPSPLEDPLCTPLPQIGVTGTQDYSQFFCYVDSNGVTQNVRVDWTNIPFHPSFPTTTSSDGTYQAFNQYPDYQSRVVSKITLPNHLAYTFSYDPAFGVLTKVTLPTGGYIRYTWAPIARRKEIPNPDLMSYVEPAQDVLVLTSRSESEDGVNEQTWNYSYGGTFDTAWTTTITDPLGNQEVHRFPGPPYSVEDQVKYLDAGGHLLKQVDNLWGSSLGTVQLGFALVSPQDYVGSTTVIVANDQPTLTTGIDVINNTYFDGANFCDFRTYSTCIVDIMSVLTAILNMPAYDTAGLNASPGKPDSDGSVAYIGARNMVLLSQTTTMYNGSQAVATTTQTDFNDCSTFMNFDAYTSSATGRLKSFDDCRDNPTQVREYGYDKPANNAVFGNGHSATSPAPASRYTDISYLHQTNSAFGPASYSRDTSLNGPFAYNTSGSHILDRVAEKKVYDGANTTASSPASDAKSTYDSHGNALTKSTWLNTSNTWLTSSFTYDSYGNMVTGTDPLGQVTSFEYADNYTDATKNTGTARFLTKTTFPSTSGVSHVTRKVYDWNTGLVMAICGENYGGSTCTWNQSPANGPIADYTAHSYDLMNRPLSVSDGGGGLTGFTYQEAALPISVSMTTRHNSNVNVVSTAVLDGLGRTKQSQLLAPECTIKTDTTYDPFGRVSTVSNPYCTPDDPTYGITTTQYDALGRVAKVIPQDGTASTNNVTIDYSNFPTVTVTDQAANLRRRTTDAFGRLNRVDEPGSPTPGAPALGSVVVSGPLRSTQVGAHGATQSSGSLTINGVEGTVYVPGDPVCVMFGEEGCLQWQTPYYPICDGGQVTLTVGGHADSTGWGCDGTAAGIASGLANAINNDGGALVWATASGATLNFASRASASTANYSWGVGVTDGEPDYFGTGSFSSSPATGSMTGGTNAFGGTTAYDSGTAQLTVGSFSSPPVPYSSSQNSTEAGLAASLAQAFTNASGAPATATASGASISIVYKTWGTSGNVAAGVSSTTNNPALFSGGSFSGSGALAGGDNPDDTGINHPLVTLYQYDVLNNLLRVDQQGSAPSDSSKWRTRTFTFDSLGRMLTAQNPESGRTSYSYDANGNMLQKVVPAQNQTGSVLQTVSYCYDALNRVTGRAYSAQTCTNGLLPSGTAVVSYAYDSGANGIGHLTGISDPAGAAAMSFDAMGRISYEQRSIAGVTKVMSYEYNFDGSVKVLHYPSGRAVTYASDSAGRALSAVDSDNLINYVTDATYAPQGALTGFVSGQTPVIGQSPSFSGITNSFSYNKRLQPVFMSASTPNQTVFSIGYDFHQGNGNNGNVYAILNNRDHSRDQTFTYDPLNRLASAQNAGTDCSQTTVNGKTKFWGNGYTYDAWGNLIAKGNLPGATWPKCNPESLDRTADGQNRLHVKVGADFQYDAAGNMTYDTSGLYYSYDPENLLTGAGGYTYTYDADGNRVKKANGPSGTLYWHMMPGVVAESDVAGTIQSEYVFFGDKRVARRDATSNGVFYYFSDHLGTTAVITDSAGAIKSESDIYPWGGELQFVKNDSNHYVYTGQEHDNETQLDYFGARYYESALGRFTSPDPDQVSGFDHMDDPQAWNGYAYVRNNPERFVDPDGREWKYCLGTDANGQVLKDNCIRGISDGQHDEDKKVHTFKDGKIYTGDTLIGSYTDLGPDIPGDPEENRRAAARIVQTYDAAMKEFAKNAAYAATGAVVLRGVGWAVEGLSAARGINTGRTVVYQSLNTAQEVQYVGITDLIENRQAQHAAVRGANFVIKEIPGLTRLSRSDARAVEQCLIEYYGLGKNGGSLLNKINSIARTNPIYAQSIQRGLQILHRVGYPGF